MKTKVIKNISKTTILFFVVVFLLPRISQAATVDVVNGQGQPSCEQVDVQSAISKAANGDTISIPAGACTWSTPVTINSSSSRTKMVKLIGAGTDATTGTRITANAGPGGPLPILNVWLSSSLSGFELSNIRFIQQAEESGDDTETAWLANLAGHADDYDSLFKIHDCVFVQKSTSVANSFIIGGTNSYGSSDNGRPYIWGVFYKNTWTGALSFQSVDIIPRYDVGSNGSNIMGVNTGNLGHLAWRDWTIADHQGTWKNVIFEDCVWSSTNTQPNFAALDAGCGGAFIVRNCVFRNNWIAGHGPDTLGGARGAKWAEIYNNEFITDSTSSSTWIMANGFKSGTGVNYNNTYWDASHKGTGNPKSITGTNNFTSAAVMLTYRRSHGKAYGAPPCQNVSCGDETSTTCDNNDIVSDPGKGGICWDQTGAKRGANVSGKTLGYTFSQEPVVFWNNRWADTATKKQPAIYGDDPPTAANVAVYLQERRDYILDTSCTSYMGESICSTFWDNVNNKKKGYVAYDYPHPLRNETPTCTPGDANSDSNINISDVQTCINVILGTDTTHQACSDMNSNSTIDITDCQAIINKILNP